MRGAILRGLDPYLPLVGNREYLIVVLGYAAYTFGFGGIATWMVTFLIRIRGLQEVTATAQMGNILVVTGFVGTWLGGVLGDTLAKRMRHGYLWLSAVSMLLATPIVYVALTAASPTVYWPGIGLAALLLFLSTSPINAVIVGDVPPASRAAAMAASILAIHLLGDFPAPTVIGRLSDISSLSRAVLIIPVAVLVSGVIWTYAALRGSATRTSRPASRSQ
jgi:hypothetical protein